MFHKKFVSLFCFSITKRRFHVTSVILFHIIGNWPEKNFIHIFFEDLLSHISGQLYYVNIASVPSQMFDQSPCWYPS